MPYKFNVFTGNFDYYDDTTVAVHGPTHIKDGGDEVDGDKLDIDWNPSTYTPATTPSEVSHVDHLTAHLYGIDNWMGVHAANVSAHHIRYTDAEAVSAMGAIGDSNPLNHNRYTDAEAVTAMGAIGDSNPLNHNRYTDAEVSVLIAIHAGLADPHTVYVKESEFTAINDILVGTGAATLVKKTPAEIMAILSGQATAPFSMNLQRITNLGHATDPLDAVNLDDVLDRIGVTLNYWFSNQVLTTTLTDSEAALSETPSSTPQTLSTITFKSTVADTPTPLELAAGEIIEIHFDADETSGAGRNVGLHCIFGYVDANGTNNFVQLGDASDSTGELTTTKTSYTVHIHVAAAIEIPAGKRLWLKFIATSLSGGGAYPEVNVYYDDPAHHILFGVSGAVLGLFLQKAGGTMSGNIDFATYKAIAMICDNGATVPTSPAPVSGQWFLHTPTGRNVLMMYDGSNWMPIISLGTMTMYVNVDGATAGDSIDKGDTTANGFSTIQYAVDQIPGLVGGNVIIYIDSGEGVANTYAEQVTIQGKNFTGNYTITLEGNLIEDSSGTSSANGTQGTGATQGVVTDTGNMGSAANRLIYLDADDEYRVVDSVTANNATICGTFTSQPLSGENYVIYSWGTKIDGGSTRDYCLHIINGQSGVIVNNMEFQGAIVQNVELDFGATADFYRCHSDADEVLVECFQTDRGSLIVLNECILECDAASTNGLRLARTSVGFVNATKTWKNSAGTRGVDCRQGSHCSVTAGSVIDGFADGIRYDQNSAGSTSSGAANGYIRIRNCTDGIDARTGGQCIGTGNNVYNGNTNDENADAATFGAIT